MGSNVGLNEKKVGLLNIVYIVVMYSYILLTNLKINMIIDVNDRVRTAIFLIIILFAFFHIFKMITSRKALVLDIIVVLYSSYTVVLLDIGNSSFFENLIPITYLPIMYLAGRYVFSKMVFNERVLEIACFVLLLVFSGCFIFNRVIIGMMSSANTIYYQLCILPSCIRSKCKPIRFLSLIIATFCVFFSEKRTAFIIWAVIVVLFLFMVFDLKNQSPINKIIICIFCVAFLVCSVFLVDSYISSKFGMSIISRLTQIGADGGSGRSDLLRMVFSELKNNSFLDTLFGHNMIPTATFADGMGAHNDFVEIYYRCGLLGSVLIFFIGARLLKYIRSISQKSYRYYCCFLCEFAMLIIFMLFSQIIFIASYNCLLAFEMALLVNVCRGDVIVNE